MTERFDLQRHVLGPLLTYGLWSWSANVFRPALVMKSLGLYRPQALGQPPAPIKLDGGGPQLSKTLAEPLLLAIEPGHYDSAVARPAQSPAHATTPMTRPEIASTSAAIANPSPRASTSRSSVAGRPSRIPASRSLRVA